jgi:hypothetical protein
METTNQQPKENLQVAKVPVDVYINASTLSLTTEENQKLMAPFADDEYEIRPDGFIYIPQALIKRRLNEVLGVGQWALVKINDRFEEKKAGVYRIFFDGALMIRGVFASRSVGESMYNETNPNQSWASALEAAKSDTIVRCCKDLGIASEVHQPAFVRAWQKKNAVKVFVKKEKANGVEGTDIAWRRKDVDPFYNETGLVPNGQFKVPSQPASSGPNTHKPAAKQADGGLPWLNEGPDYNNVVKDIEAGKTNMEEIKKKWRLNRQVTAALMELIAKYWTNKVMPCKTVADLTKVYNDNKAVVDGSEDIMAIFKTRRESMTKKAAA